MKLKASIFLWYLMVLSSYSQNHLGTAIENLFYKELEKENVHNAYLQVYSKPKGIELSFIDGTFIDGKKVTASNPFYTASIGKMFTATAIAMLKEKQLLDFNDAISKHLPKDLLTNLHVFKGVDYTNTITIAHLLQHTSGLPDYFEDTTIDGSPNIINQLFMDPDKIHDPLALIDFTKQKMQPLFQPGKGYHYTDTEYVLLGFIIEKVSGLSLEIFFKQHIFMPLKMVHTYVNLQSKPLNITDNMAEIYVGSLEVSSFKSLSADWAGGGVVSTTQDLILFMEALFNQKILKKQTLQQMQNFITESKGIYYAFGLRKVVLNELHTSLPKLEMIGHTGSTGSFLFYCPKLTTYISGTLNQIEAIKSTVVLPAKILEVILKE